MKTSFYRKNILYLFVLLGLVSGILIIPDFLSISIFSYLLSDLSIVLLVASGMVFILIMNGLDLSVGAVAGFSSLVGASLMSEGFSIAIVFVILILFGLTVALMNFIFVYYLQIHFLVSTLLVMFIIEGIGIGLNLEQVDLEHPLIVNLAKTTNNPDLYFLSPLFRLPVIVFIIVLILVKFTSLPNYFSAAASDRLSCRRSGISPAFFYFMASVVSSLSAVFAGWLFITSSASGNLNFGSNLQLDTITVTALAGLLFFKGSRSVEGIPFAALVISLLEIFFIEFQFSGFLSVNGIAALLILFVYIIRNREFSSYSEGGFSDLQQR